jgi:hypothetical protein
LIESNHKQLNVEGYTWVTSKSEMNSSSRELGEIDVIMALGAKPVLTVCSTGLYHPWLSNPNADSQITGERKLRKNKQALIAVSGCACPVTAY